MTKQRKAEMVMETMQWHRTKGRDIVVSDIMPAGVIRALIRSGQLEPTTDRTGQRCVRLPLETSQ